MRYEITELTCRLVSALNGVPASSPRAARLSVAARAVPRLGMRASSPAGIADSHCSHRPYRPAASLAESLFDILQLPAGRYRPAQQQRRFLLAAAGAVYPPSTMASAPAW